MTQGQSIAQERETATEKWSKQPERKKRKKRKPKQPPINTTTGCRKEVPLAWEHLHRVDYREEETESEGGGEGSAKPHEHETGSEVTAAFFEEYASLTR